MYSSFVKINANIEAAPVTAFTLSRKLFVNTFYK